MIEPIEDLRNEPTAVNRALLDLPSGRASLALHVQQLERSTGISLHVLERERKTLDDSVIMDRESFIDRAISRFEEIVRRGGAAH